MDPYQHLRWNSLWQYRNMRLSAIHYCYKSLHFHVGRGPESASSKVWFFKHLRFQLRPNKKLLFAKYHNRGELPNTANTQYPGASFLNIWPLFNQYLSIWKISVLSFRIFRFVFFSSVFGYQWRFRIFYNLHYKPEYEKRWMKTRRCLSD